MKNQLRKICYFFVLLCFNPLQAEDWTHEFIGYHLVASYMSCDANSLTDLQGLEMAMNEAAKASGATILSSVKHVFPPNGLTMVLLLSESHASIHTYPEYGACFVDLFTCGNSCDASKFEAVLSDYLKPQQSNTQILLRHGESQ
jgi:S-adenosylmethionine decarboxylase proenzyme